MAIKMTTEQYHNHIMAQSDDSAKRDALYQAHQRIQQLEKFNATLAAQVDRMASVVNVVEGYVERDRELPLGLLDAFLTYQRQMAQLAKDGR
jgi:hypothetical protein